MMKLTQKKWRSRLPKMKSANALIDPISNVPKRRFSNSRNNHNEARIFQEKNIAGL